MAQRSTRKRGSPSKASDRRAATAKRAAARGPDAIRLLKDDHARVQALFDRFERTRGKAQKEKLAETICSELKIHAQVEEELFYPTVRAAIDAKDLLNEAEVEHGSAKALIGQIERSSPSDEKYDALVTVLGEYIRHHVQEEEGELFPQVRQSDLDLFALGEQMRDRKRLLSGSPATRAVARIAALLSAPATA